MRIFEISTSGEEVLVFIRDTLLSWKHRRESLAEQSAKIAQIRIDPEELQEFAAIRGAAEILQHIISAGQEPKARGHQPPAWVMQLAHVGRLELIAEDPQKDEE